LSILKAVSNTVFGKSSGTMALNFLFPKGRYTSRSYQSGLMVRGKRVATIDQFTKPSPTTSLQEGERMDYQAAVQELKEALRPRTEPVGVSFFQDQAELPAKTRRPSKVFQKKVTICQGMTMARIYGWGVGITPEDIICMPAGLRPDTRYRPSHGIRTTLL
jgi:hypothetical protein